MFDYDEAITITRSMTNMKVQLRAVEVQPRDIFANLLLSSTSPLVSFSFACERIT